MQTYTLVVDGTPAATFRAQDDGDARETVEAMQEAMKQRRLDGWKEWVNWSVRPSTIPEQERWRRESVLAAEEESEDEDAEIAAGAYDNLDGLWVSLDEDVIG